MKSSNKPLVLPNDGDELVYGDFAPEDDNKIVTISENGIARVYHTGGVNLIKKVFENLSRCLNNEEKNDYSLEQISIALLSKKNTYPNIKEMKIPQQRPHCH